VRARGRGRGPRPRRGGGNRRGRPRASPSPARRPHRRRRHRRRRHRRRRHRRRRHRARPWGRRHARGRPMCRLVRTTPRAACSARRTEGRRGRRRRPRRPAPRAGPSAPRPPALRHLAQLLSLPGRQPHVRQGDPEHRRADTVQQLGRSDGLVERRLPALGHHHDHVDRRSEHLTVVGQEEGRHLDDHGLGHLPGGRHHRQAARGQLAGGGEEPFDGEAPRRRAREWPSWRRRRRGA